MWKVVSVLRAECRVQCATSLSTQHSALSTLNFYFFYIFYSSPVTFALTVSTVLTVFTRHFPLWNNFRDRVACLPVPYLTQDARLSGILTYDATHSPFSLLHAKLTDFRNHQAQYCK